MIRDYCVENVKERDKMGHWDLQFRVIVFFLLFAGLSTVWGDIITVDDDGVADFNNIQAAIDDANDGDVVEVQSGTYTGIGNRDIDFLGKAITVRSANGAEYCIIDCEGMEQAPHRGFYFHSGEESESVLDGFSITNGYAYGTDSNRHGGGAIRCDDSSPMIMNCIFTRNYAAWDGGAINNLNSDPTIVNCSFIDNEAIENDGGGINNYKSSPQIINCIFSGNSAYDWGGGIRNLHTSSPTIINCFFNNNSSDEGAGIFDYNDSTPAILNCTFIGNLARTGGGGIDSQEYCVVTISNCIIWDNDGPALSGGQYDVSYSNIEGSFIGLGNIDVDPCFVDSINGDYHLKSEGWRWYESWGIWTWDDVTSLCIDAGNPGSGLGDELLSVPRDPDNEWGENVRINMGAYGGTAKASMGPVGWALLADVNNDGVVDFVDVGIWAGYWLEAGDELPGDLNRDGVVEGIDFALVGLDFGN